MSVLTRSAMNKGMLVTVLYRIAGQPEIEYTQYYDTVTDGKYYSKAVTWAHDSGIIGEEFDPAESMDDEDMEEIISNFLGESYDIDESKAITRKEAVSIMLDVYDRAV